MSNITIYSEIREAKKFLKKIQKEMGLDELGKVIYKEMKPLFQWAKSNFLANNYNPLMLPGIRLWKSKQYAARVVLDTFGSNLKGGFLRMFTSPKKSIRTTKSGANRGRLPQYFVLGSKIDPQMEIVFDNIEKHFIKVIND